MQNVLLMVPIGVDNDDEIVALREVMQQEVFFLGVREAV